ncbi:MAG: cation:proton antiporter [Candidatus Auribacter fodinae]|jgi:Kef-type K+ transport system membrane component KefB|uniref:Cation:proton antiporter n=1 Tax=Candidatus Auribacter fodinae TaxID=2093366 RepID=A0A3A4R6N5_9BACT|nr:MAG: cation:proton antiporter [Candidatus Auribacter fodinae]
MSGLTFLIMFMFLMALTAIVPALLRRFHIPSVVSMMMVGIVIGPNMLDVIRKLNYFLGRGYPTADIYLVLNVLGLLGLIFLMVLAGMEVHLSVLRLERKAVAWLSVLTFAIPALAGYFVYAFFEPGHTIGKLVYASLFASHSVGIVFPVIRELKVTRTRFGIAVLASTVITDLASLVLLAVCIQMSRHSTSLSIPGSVSIFDHIDPSALGSWFFVLFIIAIVGYIVLSMWLIPVIAQKVFSRIHHSDDSRLTFFLVGVLAVVLVGEFIGVSVIVGAFVAGMAIVRAPGFHDNDRILHRKIEGMGYGFLVPFLFLTIGMNTDLKILFNAWENIAMVVLTFVGLTASKIVSGWVAMRLSGFNNAKGICAGLMTVPQLSATLAAANVALHLKMIRPEFFNSIVCLSILTTIPVPTLVKYIISKWNIRFDQVEDQVLQDFATEPEEEII